MYGGIAVKTILLYFQLEVARFTYVELILSAGLVLDVIRLHFSVKFRWLLLKLAKNKFNISSTVFQRKFNGALQDLTYVQLKLTGTTISSRCLRGTYLISSALGGLKFILKSLSST